MHDTETIGEILGRLVTAEGQEFLAATEQSYRRGYQHGYEAALDDLQKMLATGVDPQMILRRMVTHAEGSVMDWRRGAVDGIPPRMTP